MKRIIISNALVTICLFIFFLSYSYIYAQLPSILWWFDTKDASAGQTAAGDIDNDGKLELVFGCYRNDSCIYALNAEDGSLLWKYNTSLPNFEGCNDVAALIYDVDKDKNLDVIVPSSCNPTTFCFNGKDGSVKWQTRTRGSDSPPTIADLDGDGKLDLLHGEFGGWVICLDAETGSVNWEIAVDLNSWIQTAPTIADLDGDSKLDFVVATWVLDTINQNRIYAYRGYDRKLLWSYNLDGVVYHGTAISDIDLDGKPELIIGDYSGRLYVLNGEDGSLLWSFYDETNYAVYSPVTVADLDGDGICELVFTTMYYVYALNNDGTIFWKYTVPQYSGSFRGPALSDLNDDGLPDVVFGTSSGKVIALNGLSGSEMFIIDLEQHYGKRFTIGSAPVLADFNDDGRMDLFIVGGWSEYPNFRNNYGRAYAITISKNIGEEWLMFQKNELRTGNICNIPTFIKSSSYFKPEDIKVYPNPSTDYFNIQVPNELLPIFNFEILDIFGNQIRNFELSNVYIQNNCFVWDGKDNSGNKVSSGIYFTKIVNNSGIFLFKINKIE